MTDAEIITQPRCLVCGAPLVPGEPCHGCLWLESAAKAKDYLRLIGRKGGQAKSEAKTKAVRANAKKPRPRRKLKVEAL